LFILLTCKVYKDALRGVVVPHDKEVTAEDLVALAEEHNEGSSLGLTSWTKNKKTAEVFAGEGGCILTARLGPDHGQRLLWSPDGWLEDEVIVQGCNSWLLCDNPGEVKHAKPEIVWKQKPDE
jgi:hypothetical protein